MRRRPASPPVSPFVWVRRLALPAIALVLAFTLFGDGFDPAELRDDLAARRIEDALDSLQRLKRDERIPEYLPELAAITDWRSAGSRAASLKHLRARRDADELYEFPGFPTLVAPLGTWRDSPREIRLREPAPVPLQLQIDHLGLGMAVATVDIPAGAQVIDPGVRLVEGSSFLMTLSESDTGALVGVERFAILPAPMAHDVGLVLAAAKDLAPDAASAELLVAIAAMNFGLHQEALRRLAGLEPDAEPELLHVARELRAIAYDALGLDRTALALIERE